MHRQQEQFYVNIYCKNNANEKISPSVIEPYGDLITCDVFALFC